MFISSASFTCYHNSRVHVYILHVNFEMLPFLASKSGVLEEKNDEDELCSQLGALRYEIYAWEQRLVKVLG